ncbi:transcriptional regulator [Deltaproteobacteria bacterium]|nr:transcriptional regulator [Deltaproteobacteria bacterium]
MSEYLSEALAIVKAQASIRTMTGEEIASLLKALTDSIKDVAEGGEQAGIDAPVIEATKSIKEKSVVCLECGKAFKIISKKHLAAHGLDAAAYKEKWGLKPKTVLVAKSLQRQRRKKMQDMKLWERRGKAEKPVKPVKVKAKSKKA